MTKKRLTRRHRNYADIEVIKDLTLRKLSQCMKKLQEYENAEIDGKLVVFPCKRGDTVFLVDDTGEITEHVVAFFSSGANNSWEVHFEHYQGCVGINDFGKFAFTSFENAEDASDHIRIPFHPCECSVLERCMMDIENEVREETGCPDWLKETSVSEPNGFDPTDFDPVF